MLATAVAVAVAVQGVGFVGREVTDQRPAALSVDEVQAALRDGSGDLDATPTTSSSTTTISAAPESGGGGPSTTVAPAPSGSRTPAGTSSPGAGSPSGGSTSGTGGGGSTPTTASSSTTRTYTLVGGSASIRYEPGNVTVLWATPNSGFEVDVETYAADRVEVQFRSDTHESKVTAWWDSGPRDEIDEEERSSGSGSD